MTDVKTVDIDNLDEFFDIPGADTVITPTVVEDTKKTILSPDIELIPSLEGNKEEVNVDEIIPDIISFDELKEQAEEANKSAGRSKTDKSGIVELYKKKILAGQLVPFSDFEVESDDKEYESKLEDYLSKLPNKDLEELWDANLSRKEQELNEKIPQEFFGSLPRELQFAAKYVADGGTDMKGLFKALSQTEEVRALDPDKDAREISYQYLKATNFGDEDEIKEQLDEWEDMNVLGKKSTAFKPKLDKMSEQIVQQKLVEQEQYNKQRIEAANEYVSNVQESLKAPELAGIKLDKKTHEFLVQGLLNPVYPSINGNKTNLLGHLLEQHQVVKPNHALVAEAMWLLADPDGYRAKLMEKGGSNKTEKIVRELKTEQGRRTISSTIEEEKPRTTFNNRTLKPNRNFITGK